MFLDIVWTALFTFHVVVLAYFVLLNGYYFITSVLSFRALRQHARSLNATDTADLIRFGGAPPVSVLVPAYNEAANCLATLRSLLDLEYPEYEILFINDGSTDETIELIRDAYELVPAFRLTTSDLGRGAVKAIYQSATVPHLWVIDNENGGKPDALKHRLEYCQDAVVLRTRCGHGAGARCAGSALSLLLPGREPVAAAQSALGPGPFGDAGAGGGVRTAVGHWRWGKPGGPAEPGV